MVVDSPNPQIEIKEQPNSLIGIDKIDHPLIYSFNCAGIGGQDPMPGTLSGGTFQHISLYRCTITGSDLSNCTILECDITDCTLYDSDITRSVVEKTTFKHNVRAIECLIKECHLRKSEFDECNIELSRIFHSKVVGGLVKHSADLRHSFMAQNSIITCDLFDCDVQQASATMSVFNESKVIDSSTLECSFTSSPLALRKFAPEIRDLIFRYVIEWSGQTPALIVALRGDHKLYHEALEILYSTCTFVLSEHNSSTIAQMLQPAVDSIRKLVLNLGPPEDLRYMSTSIATIPTNFHTAMCITELKLIFPHKSPDNGIPVYMVGNCWHMVEEAFQSWLSKLGTIRKLSLEIYGVYKKSLATNDFDLKQKVRELDMRWGIKRPQKKSATTQARIDAANFICSCRLSWEANPGETLLWKWDTTPAAVANDAEW